MFTHAAIFTYIHLFPANAAEAHSSSLISNFSPRMDFDQWKPLTGRGDPLRNDPTYDYEPPILERVHYWADDTRVERDHYPERKSEILMLGVSSRKPSIAATHPPQQTRRPLIRPTTPKYEDFAYNLSENYPMTILVPPPPPPLGHQPSLFILTENNLPTISSQMKQPKPPKFFSKNSTTRPEMITSSYALQESNLIFQSSTTENWLVDSNKTLPPLSNTVSSDYAGWGPTTPIEENSTVNETQNLIQTERLKVVELPFKFYRPMLSESPPPAKVASSPAVLPTFLPTVLPSTEMETTPFTQVTWPTEQATYETTPKYDSSEEDTNEKHTSELQATPHTQDLKLKPEISLLDMLGPMMSMPMINGPERPEDNLYAHATGNRQVYQIHEKENIVNLETMQTLQPPPRTTISEIETEDKQQQTFYNQNFRKPSVHTHDPYLHMRYTPPISTLIDVDNKDKQKSTTESPTTPMNLIIQGHSKVKTYSSKPNPVNEYHDFKNEIPKPNETTEVKHLHPFKDKSSKKIISEDISKKNRAKNLRTLLDRGLGSVEIQEADVGIKYDVSDGSDVPVEIYKKGIVDNDENAYKLSSKSSNEIRPRRQIDLENIFPGDDDSFEELLISFFENNNALKNKKVTKNVNNGQISTGINIPIGDGVTDREEESER